MEMTMLPKIAGANRRWRWPLRFAVHAASRRWLLFALNAYYTPMLTRIRQMFSMPKLGLSDESRDFITKLAPSHIWLLAIGLRGTPAMPSELEAAFEMLDRHRIDVSAIGDDDSVYPFNYRRDDIQILPFFSSEERARAFRANCGFQTSLSYFQPYNLLTGFVATPENEMFELILDPRSPAERKLTRDERLLLRSLSTAV